jgi:hypothetical protein
VVTAGTAGVENRHVSCFRSGRRPGSWTRKSDTVQLAPLLVQPLAPGDVADVLTETATGQGLFGPEMAGEQDPTSFDDWLAAGGASTF